MKKKNQEEKGTKRERNTNAKEQNIKGKERTTIEGKGIEREMDVISYRRKKSRKMKEELEGEK